jgi:hypothetical protein
VAGGCGRVLATDTDLWDDPVWIVDSTPVECARSRPTVKRSNLAGWAGYGYCASHPRFFWGLCLHLVCTPAGLPITWALADPKLDERQVLMAVLYHDPGLANGRLGLTIIADKGYASAELDRYLAERSVTLLRPSATTRRAAACCSRTAGQVGERAGQRARDEPQPAGLRAHPEQHLGHGQGEQLGIRELGWSTRSGAAAQVVVDLDVQCGQEGVQVGRHKLILNALLLRLRPPRR